MKVLSLFDGMACGMIAMQLSGVEVESYDAYEIDKYAVKTAQHNFPIIREHGDVFVADFTQYEGVDFLVGGSPCTYWSIAQTKNRETLASGMGWELFSQYVRALREAKPKYFIYENNKSMSKQIRASIDEAFGFEAVLINSALVSAQNRQRLYWVGKRNDDGTYSKVNVEQPEDRGILLKDVLDSAVAMREKGHAVIASAGRTTEREYFIKNQGNMAAEPVDVFASSTVKVAVEDVVAKKGYIPEMWNPYNRAEIIEKSPTLSTGSMVTSSCATIVAEPIGIKHLGSLYGQHSRCGVFDEEGKAPTLTASAGMGGGHLPMVKEAAQVGAMSYTIEFDENGRPIKANGGGLGGHGQGLYALPVDEPKCYAVPVYECPKDCEIVITDNSIRCMRHDAKRSTVQGSHVNFEDGKSQTLSPSHVARVLCYAAPCEFDENGEPTKAVSCSDGKVYPVYKVENGQITIKGKQYPIKLVDGYYIIRKLTVSECMRLQTVPEWYDFSCVSNSQAYKMLGNGWTCEVITHLIKSCLTHKPEDCPRVSMGT